MKEATAAGHAQEKDLFSKAWGILEKYYDLDYKDPDAIWDAFEAECRTLSSAADDTPAAGLADDLSIAVINHIQALCKERNATK